jgi:hypothetical protein
MRAVAAAVVLTAALASTQAASAQQSMSPSAYASAYVSLTNQVAQIVQSDKGNCLKMATDLKAWSAAHQATIKQLDVVGRTISKTSMIAVAFKIEGQIVSDVQKIETGVGTCATNAQVAAALAAENKLQKP